MVVSETTGILKDEIEVEVFLLEKEAESTPNVEIYRRLVSLYKRQKNFIKAWEASKMAQLLVDINNIA
jgi:hypothetical protein